MCTYLQPTNQTLHPNPHVKKSSIYYYQLMLVSTIYESRVHVKFGAVCPQAKLARLL